MKIKLMLVIAAGLFIYVACNEGSKTNVTNKETIRQSAPMQDSIKMDNGLMKSINEMMAKIDDMKMSGNFDTDFANMMIGHQQGAIDMAKHELSKGSNNRIKIIAQKIITRQTKEQEKMKEIINSFKDCKAKSVSSTTIHLLHDAMINMMDKMKGMQKSVNTDKDFVMMMIPHHESAIEMAKNELLHGKNAELKQIAKKQIDCRTKDVNKFKSWLTVNE